MFLNSGHKKQVVGSRGLTNRKTPLQLYAVFVLDRPNRPRGVRKRFPQRNPLERVNKTQHPTRKGSPFGRKNEVKTSKQCKPSQLYVQNRFVGVPWGLLGPPLGSPGPPFVQNCLLWVPWWSLRPPLGSPWPPLARLRALLGSPWAPLGLTKG